MGIPQPTGSQAQSQSVTPTPIPITQKDIAFLRPLMADFVAVTVKATTDGFSNQMIQAL